MIPFDEMMFSTGPVVMTDTRAVFDGLTRSVEDAIPDQTMSTSAAAAGTVVRRVFSAKRRRSELADVISVIEL
jgi:hypothetical protein